MDTSTQRRGSENLYRRQNSTHTQNASSCSLAICWSACRSRVTHEMSLSQPLCARVASSAQASCSLAQAPLARTTGSLRAAKPGVAAPSRLSPHQQRICRRMMTQTYAFFDLGGDGARGNDDGDGKDGGSGSNDNRPPPERRSLQSLIALLLSIPARLDQYYSPANAIAYAFRRTVWCVISAGAGFYAGNIVTLSFGALAINDVFAGVVTLLFYELVTRLFYSEGSLGKKSLKMWFVNYFKMGVVLSCLADAIKLGG